MKAMNLFPRLLFSLVVMVLPTLLLAQEQKPPSSGEVEAAKKVEAAQGVPAKIKQAEEFMKKNAKSSLRIKVAEYLAAEIGYVNDANQRLGYIDQYTKIFSADNEKDLILASQVDALAAAGRVEDAFKLAPKALEKSPDNALLLTQLTLRGSNLMRQGKEELAAPSKQYGLKALELIEANKKPAHVNDQFWNEFKQKWLPELYQALGFIAYNEKDMADAKAKFQKVVELSPANPNGYLMLGSIANDEYQKYAMEYNTASGVAKDAALKKAHEQLDLVIDYYAHVIALAEPKPELKQLHDQVLPVLQEYYKFRKGSLDGLQQLIDKYKSK